jgi:glycosyltransferase involved in cell wall biosynthesis
MPVDLLRPIKGISRKVFKLSMNWLVAIRLSFGVHKRDQARLFFAGAIPGSRGGPRVKFARLKKEFPQRLLRFNVIYVLSNYPYLNLNSIQSCKASSIPLVLNQNGVYFPGWFGPRSVEANFANRLIYQNSSYVFWQSEFARRASRLFLDTLDPPGEILFNAVDLDSFYPNSLRDIHKRNFRFLIAGKFTSSTLYQVEAGIQALALLKDSRSVKLVVAGLTRFQRNHVADLIRQSGVSDSIYIVGPYGQTDAPNLMRSVDAYLALKHMDTCPNLVIEALASGLPVIYSNSGGTPELVGSEAGIPLYAPDDWNCPPIVPSASNIAEAIQEVMHRQKNMAILARSRAEAMFDIGSWYKRHREIFQVVSGNRL